LDTSRHLPLASMSITNVIISYYIEILNAMVSLFCFSIIYVLAIKPIPLFVAQFIYIFVQCSFSLITALGSAVSCFQILYVIKFDMLFSMDPHQVVRRTFIVLATVICSPNAALAIYHAWQGQPIATALRVLTHKEFVSGRGNFTSLYSLGWAGLFFILSSIAFVLIPVFFKKRRNGGYVDPLAPQRTVSLQRYLLGSVGFFIMFFAGVLSLHLNDGRHIPVVIHILSLSLDLLLLYHLTEVQARTAITRYLVSLFNIKERNPHSEEMTGEIPQFIVARKQDIIHPVKINTGIPEFITNMGREMPQPSNQGQEISQSTMKPKKIPQSPEKSQKILQSTIKNQEILQLSLVGNSALDSTNIFPKPKNIIVSPYEL
jgi:hypothetical protein